MGVFFFFDGGALVVTPGPAGSGKTPRDVAQGAGIGPFLLHGRNISNSVSIVDEHSTFVSCTGGQNCLCEVGLLRHQFLGWDDFVNFVNFSTRGKYGSGLPASAIL